MTAYEIMREWDSEAGLLPRSDHDLDVDIPGGLEGDYDAWKAALEESDVAAILEGRAMWRLSPLS